MVTAAPTAPHSLDEIKAIAANLPKYNTTRSDCECGDNKHRGRERKCKHINVAMILLGGKFPCARCGLVGQWLNQKAECANGCQVGPGSKLSDGQHWCVACGYLVDIAVMQHVQIDGMYAHAGGCAKRSGMQDEIDSAALAAWF